MSDYSADSFAAGSERRRPRPVLFTVLTIIVAAAIVAGAMVGGAVLAVHNACERANDRWGKLDAALRPLDDVIRGQTGPAVLADVHEAAQPQDCPP